MVLIDSSVWVAFLQSGVEPQLVELLRQQQVLMHEMVLGEVAMGSQQQRKNALELLPLLPMAQVASHHEVMVLIDKQRLHGWGVGYVDVHLLTTAVLQPGVQIWTRDRRLLAAAVQLGIAFAHTLH